MNATDMPIRWLLLILANSDIELRTRRESSGGDERGSKALCGRHFELHED